MKKLLCLALGHKWNKWAVGVNAKYELRYCVRCAKQEKRRVVG